MSRYDETKYQNEIYKLVDEPPDSFDIVVAQGLIYAPLMSSYPNKIFHDEIEVDLTRFRHRRMK